MVILTTVVSSNGDEALPRNCCSRSMTVRVETPSVSRPSCWVPPHPIRSADRSEAIWQCAVQKPLRTQPTQGVLPPIGPYATNLGRRGRSLVTV